MLLAFCFAAWGSAANLTDVMVGVFRHSFGISNARSALIQTAYYGGYFRSRSPRPSSTSGFSYKTHVLTGLGVAALGAGLFFPASKLLAFWVCLDALLGAVLILPRITTPGTALTAAQLHQAHGKNLSLVVGPYLGIAVVLVLGLWWLHVRRYRRAYTWLREGVRGA
jgi:MFS transporter, FHS family, L-fucose permease